MGELFKEFMNLFRGDESPILKLAKFLAVLAVLFAAVIALESAMGLVTIGRLERKVNLLKELNALAENGIAAKRELKPIFLDTLRDFRQYNPDLGIMLSKSFPDDHQPDILEVLSGASLWILMGLAMLNSIEGGCLVKLTGSVLVIIVGIAAGAITDFMIETPIPILTLVLNFAVGSMLLVLAGFVLTRFTRRRNQTLKTETSENQEN